MGVLQGDEGWSVSHRSEGEKRVACTHNHVPWGAVLGVTKSNVETTFRYSIPTVQWDVTRENPALPEIPRRCTSARSRNAEMPKP